jgi:hypothetical protein
VFRSLKENYVLTFWGLPQSENASGQKYRQRQHQRYDVAQQML